MKIQDQYDTIYSFFKTTTEPFDSIDWDGKVCEIVLNDITIETYTLADLRYLMPEYECFSEDT